MYQRIISIIISLSFLASSVSAQIKLSGTVVDANTKLPLEFANIALLKPDSTFIAGASCDSIGHFTFDNLSQGDYLLSSTFVGYNQTYTPVAHLEKDLDWGTIALQSSGVMLKEVTVTGSTVIQKADRKLLIPSSAQIRASDNGVTLLRNLQLSRIVINPINNTITTPNGSPVQLRINGIEVTPAEVVALQPQDIIRIEYHEDPGMRYGDAAAVIDYITRRRDSGGSLSTNLTNAFWRLGFVEDYLSAKVNHKKSEFGVNAYYDYKNFNWTRENRQTFVYPTMTLHQDEIGTPTKSEETKLNLVLNYNLNEPDKYLFNLTFRNNYDNIPNSGTDRISTLYTYSTSHTDTIPSSISDHSTWKNNTPALDIYFQRNLPHEQLLIFDMVGTYMDSKSTRLYRQTQIGTNPYEIYSCITGNKYSLIAEGIYEKKWKTGTLTGGVRHVQSYTENNYSGNVSSHVGLVVAQTYGYAEYQLRKNKFNYALGLGTTRTFYSQDANRIEKYIFRPVLRAAYNINNDAYIRYTGYVAGYSPSLSDLNNVSQNIDAYQIQQGNPNLLTAWYADNSINAGYNKGIFGIGLYAQYYYIHKPIMEQIFLTDSLLVHTNMNQGAYRHIYLLAALKMKPYKDYITLSLTPAFDRYTCEGTDYLHTYNEWSIRASLLAVYKNWVLYADVQTRRNDFYGETLMMNNFPLITFTAGYNTQRWGAGILLANPFSSELSQGAINYSALTPYTSNAYTRNLGQVILFKFTLNLSFGRKYNTVNKRLDNTDTDSGIMTGTKK